MDLTHYRIFIYSWYSILVYTYFYMYSNLCMNLESKGHWIGKLFVQLIVQFRHRSKSLVKPIATRSYLDKAFKRVCSWFAPLANGIGGELEVHEPLEQTPGELKSTRLRSIARGSRLARPSASATSPTPTSSSRVLHTVCSATAGRQRLVRGWRASFGTFTWTRATHLHQPLYTCSEHRVSYTRTVGTTRYKEYG